MGRRDGAGADGYLAHVFRHAAKELFDEHVEEVTYRALRCEGRQGGARGQRGRSAQPPSGLSVCTGSIAHPFC